MYEDSHLEAAYEAQFEVEDDDDFEDLCTSRGEAGDWCGYPLDIYGRCTGPYDC